MQKELVKAYEGMFIPGFAPVCKCKPELPESLEISPTDISTFMKTLKKKEESKVFGLRAGLLVTNLIQKSFNQGHNDFKISTKKLNEPLEYLCSGIKGKPDKYLKVSVDGNAGYSLAAGARYVDMKFRGECLGHFGAKAKNSILRCTEEGELECARRDAGPDCQLYLIKGEKEVPYTKFRSIVHNFKKMMA